MTYDSATWLAFALVLTAVGGALTWVSWRRRGITSALRGLAWTVLPLAAWMTGTLRLVVEIVTDIGRWATHLVFSPVVWLGIILVGVAVVLFGVSAALRARGIGTAAGTDRRVTGAQDPRAVPSPRGAGSVPAPKAARKQSQRSAAKPAADDDMDEIEAILKKHGI